MTAPASPVLDTHALLPDPPHTLSSVARWTCTWCGCAVLKNGPVIYGSATTQGCGGPR